MKKLFQKDEVWFAVLWIVIYVIGFSTADGISESIGMPKLITVLFGMVLSLLLISFIKKEGLLEYFGLCRFKGSYRIFLFFIPLAAITSINMWNGLKLNSTWMTAVLSVLSMCFVGFIEEVIFRGFLFKGMCNSNVKTAIIVSSLTFGMGHIVNLLLGAEIMETLLQLVYASAVGFCYTVIFLKGGSIVPCIISHIFVNSSSIFAIEPSGEAIILMAAIQSVLSIGYGIWLLKKADGEFAKQRG